MNTNFRKIIAAVGIMSFISLSFIAPASAAIMTDDTEYISVPGTTNKVTGTLLINKGDSSPYPISAYGQTILSGFLAGTAPVDSLSVSVVACVTGNCSSKQTSTAVLGQSTPSVTIALGNNQGSLVYTATGNHSAKKSGVTYSPPNTTVSW